MLKRLLFAALLGLTTTISATAQSVTPQKAHQTLTLFHSLIIADEFSFGCPVVSPEEELILYHQTRITRALAYISLELNPDIEKEFLKDAKNLAEYERNLRGQVYNLSCDNAEARNILENVKPYVVQARKEFILAAAENPGSQPTDAPVLSFTNKPDLSAEALSLVREMKQAVYTKAKADGDEALLKSIEKNQKQILIYYWLSKDDDNMTFRSSAAQLGEKGMRLYEETIRAAVAFARFAVKQSKSSSMIVARFSRPSDKWVAFRQTAIVMRKPRWSVARGNACGDNDGYVNCFFFVTPEGKVGVLVEPYGTTISTKNTPIGKPLSVSLVIRDGSKPADPLPSPINESAHELAPKLFMSNWPPKMDHTRTFQSDHGANAWESNVPAQVSYRQGARIFYFPDETIQHLVKLNFADPVQLRVSFVARQNGEAFFHGLDGNKLPDAKSAALTSFPLFGYGRAIKWATTP